MNKPISQWFMRRHSFKPNDIAVLMALIALQESADEIGMPISRVIEERIWCLEMSKQEVSESIDRLIDLGEVEWVQMIDARDGSIFEGYRVTCMDSLKEDLADYGRREYNKRAQRKHRESKQQAVGV